MKKKKKEEKEIEKHLLTKKKNEWNSKIFLFLQKSRKFRSAVGVGNLDGYDGGRSKMTTVENQKLL